MNEILSDFIVCDACEKKIRYERPNFCPFCGAKVDPAQGITDEPFELYPSSRIAPLMAKSLWTFLGLVFVGALFGKKVVTLICVLFCVWILFLFVGSRFTNRK